MLVISVTAYATLPTSEGNSLRPCTLRQPLESSASANTLRSQDAFKFAHNIGPLRLTHLMLHLPALLFKVSQHPCDVQLAAS